MDHNTDAIINGVLHQQDDGDIEEEVEEYVFVEQEVEDDEMGADNDMLETNSNSVVYENINPIPPVQPTQVQQVQQQQNDDFLPSVNSFKQYINYNLITFELQSFYRATNLDLANCKIYNFEEFVEQLVQFWFHIEPDEINNNLKKAYRIFGISPSHPYEERKNMIQISKNQRLMQIRELQYMTTQFFMYMSSNRTAEHTYQMPEDETDQIKLQCLAVEPWSTCIRERRVKTTGERLAEKQKTVIAEVDKCFDMYQAMFKLLEAEIEVEWVRLNQNAEVRNNGQSVLDLTYTKLQVKDVNKIILHMLRELRMRNCKRQGDRVMEEILFTHPVQQRIIHTRTYREFCHVEKFAFRVIDQVKHPELWLLLTSQNYGRYLAYYLEHCTEPQFPDLVVDRYLLSFLNGVYHVKERKFYSYDELSLPNNVACLRFFKHIEFDNKPYAKPWLIPTPNMDKVFNYQKFDDDTKPHLYASLGRLFFWKGDLTDDQYDPFHIGAPGTGKTRLIEAAKVMFTDDLLFNLSGNIQKDFGLENSIGKYAYYVNDLKNGHALDSSTAHNLLEGGSTTINQKNKKNISTRWRLNGLWTANELNKSWRDEGGSLARRWCFFYWKYPVRTEDIDTRIIYNIEHHEVGNLIRKCVECYHYFVERCGDKSYETCWSEQMRRMNKEVNCLLNPLVGFLESNHVDFGKEFFCLEKDFKSGYLEFCRQRNYTPGTWNPHVFGRIFAPYGIKYEQRETCTIDGNTYTNEHFFTGVQIKSQKDRVTEEETTATTTHTQESTKIGGTKRKRIHMDDDIEEEDDEQETLKHQSKKSKK